MLLDVSIEEKIMGTKPLFCGLLFAVEAHEKVALIGRNGVGKTTLLRMVAGMDGEYVGRVSRGKDVRIVATHQEYHFPAEWSCLDYILHQLPEYDALSQTIASYTEAAEDDMALVMAYTEALERFYELDYDLAPAKAKRSLETYQIPADLYDQPFAHLSGGQKKFVDLVRVELSSADLALIDEPTNHMDYVAKAAFLRWLQTTKRAVLAVSHDRDVLEVVGRILEIKDQRVYSFSGNYQAYLAQNSLLTVSQVNQYEIAEKTINNIKQQIGAARAKKAGWSGTADKSNPFVVLENRLTKQLKELQANLNQPSFWIDQESVDQLNKKVVERYDRYKARNLRLRADDTGRAILELVAVSDLSLGYVQPLFEGLTFRLGSDERLQIKGRNGVGKTTLIQAIIAVAHERPLSSKLLHGKITISPNTRLGVYEQEIGREYLDQPLAEAIMAIYQASQVTLNEQSVRQILASYLFDPMNDYQLPVRHLSGGQKARLQLIAMLSASPNLLILDEPTNHLDLPSIEELEKYLISFKGAIIYISHDSHFSRHVGGEVLQVG